MCSFWVEVCKTLSANRTAHSGSSHAKKFKIIDLNQENNLVEDNLQETCSVNYADEVKEAFLKLSAA